MEIGALVCAHVVNEKSVTVPDLPWFILKIL